MKTHLTHISNHAFQALLASGVIITMLLAAYFVAEPAVGRGQVAQESFYIRQQITAESSFLVPPSDISMSQTINGVTGGQATGTTQFVVQTNNAAGYTVTIGFENNGNTAMIGETSASEALRNYGWNLTEPTYGFSPSTSAQFAYTVMASSSATLDQSFLGQPSACNDGGGSQFPASGARCWMMPDQVTDFTIMDSDSPAITGATSSLVFYVNVPSGADPVPQAEYYTATATLSLFLK